MKATSKTDFFVPIISEYTAEEAIEDGILMPNPRRNRFNECDKISIIRPFKCHFS